MYTSFRKTMLSYVPDEKKYQVNSFVLSCQIRKTACCFLCCIKRLSFHCLSVVLPNFAGGEIPGTGKLHEDSQIRNWQVFGVESEWATQQAVSCDKHYLLVISDQNLMENSFVSYCMSYLTGLVVRIRVVKDQMQRFLFVEVNFPVCL